MWQADKEDVHYKVCNMVYCSTNFLRYLESEEHENFADWRMIDSEYHDKVCTTCYRKEKEPHSISSGGGTSERCLYEYCTKNCGYTWSMSHSYLKTKEVRNIVSDTLVEEDDVTYRVVVYEDVVEYTCRNCGHSYTDKTTGQNKSEYVEEDELPPFESTDEPHTCVFLGYCDTVHDSYFYDVCEYDNQKHYWDFRHIFCMYDGCYQTISQYWCMEHWTSVGKVNKGTCPDPEGGQYTNMNEWNSSH